RTRHWPSRRSARRRRSARLASANSRRRKWVSRLVGSCPSLDPWKTSVATATTTEIRTYRKKRRSDQARNACSLPNPRARKRKSLDTRRARSPTRRWSQKRSRHWRIWKRLPVDCLGDLWCILCFVVGFFVYFVHVDVECFLSVRAKKGTSALNVL